MTISLVSDITLKSSRVWLTNTIQNTIHSLLNSHISMPGGQFSHFRDKMSLDRDTGHRGSIGTGPPFRGSAIPGIRVRVRVRVGFGLGLSLADLRKGGPPEWWTPGMADRNRVNSGTIPAIPGRLASLARDRPSHCNFYSAKTDSTQNYQCESFTLRNLLINSWTVVYFHFLSLYLRRFSEVRHFWVK